MQTQKQYTFHDRKAATRLIISADGEGVNFPLPAGVVHPDEAVSANGWHTYTLLAASDDNGSDGRHRALQGPFTGREPDGELARNYGLATRDCLEFLLSLPGHALVASFYFSYDVTKIIADLPVPNIRELATEHTIPRDDCEACAESGRLCAPHYYERIDEIAGQFGIPAKTVATAGGNSNSMISGNSTIWDNYWIHYIPRKKLTVVDLSAGRQWIQETAKSKPKGKWARAVTVWDVFGFFQKSFVAALRDAAGICPPDIIDRIEVMKNQRGDFVKLTTSQILEYCYEECYYLSKLVRDMLANLERFGLTLNAFDGTGAIARAWMTRERIKDYKSDTNLPFDIQLRGYFGGRFEVSELGYMGKLYSNDINSAYPYVATTLPCLAHGEFRQLQPDASGHVPFIPDKFGIYLCGSKTTGRFAPFPFRIDDTRAMANPGMLSGKSVYYAHGGRRWVWSNADPRMSEVGIARKHFGRSAIPLYDGWVWESTCSEHGCNGKPFRAIPEMFAERRKLKADGPGSLGYDGIEKVIKLLLNSIYGKTAQSVGTVIMPDGTIKLPTNTSFIWAGLITSGCRAMILDGVMQGDVVSIATDGILSRKPLTDILPVSKALGDWDSEIVEDGYLFQSGVYTMLKPCKPGCQHRGTPEMDSDGVIVMRPYEHEYTSDGRPAVRTYKTRGFSRREIPAQKLIDAWETHDVDALTDIEPLADSTRFVPFKAGVLRNDALEYIGQWVRSNHKVTISHNRRIPDTLVTDTGWPVEDIGVTFGSQPYTFADSDMSAGYKLKETWEDVESEREHAEGDYFEWRDETRYADRS